MQPQDSNSPKQLPLLLIVNRQHSEINQWKQRLMSIVMLAVCLTVSTNLIGKEALVEGQDWIGSAGLYLLAGLALAGSLVLLLRRSRS